MTQSSKHTSRGGGPGFGIPLALRSCSEELESTLGDWSRASAREVLAELWDADVERLCGERWKPRPKSKITRAGWCNCEINLGGIRVEVRRPRVRSTEGKEIDLPSFKAASRGDVLDRQALADVMAAVTTGSFPLDRHPREGMPAEFVEHLAVRLGAEHAVPKGIFDTGLLMAPIDFPDQSFLGAVGIDSEGKRRIVGLRAGAADSENNVRGLVDDVIRRHIGQTPPNVFIVGESSLMASAIQERFGQTVLVQRCQYDKRRRVLGLVPPSEQPPILEALLAAYASPDAKTAKRALQRIQGSLKEAQPEAAAALGDHLDDTLTLLRLGTSSPQSRVSAHTGGTAPRA